MLPAVRLAVSPVVAFITLGALAQVPAQDAGWHLGGGIRPVAQVAQDDTDADIGYRNFGGYRFSRNWGVELGYSDLGRGNEVEPGPQATQKFGLQTSAWTLAGTGVLPLGQSFSLKGRLGLSMATPDATLSSASANGTGTAFPRYRPSLSWGLGGQYDLTGTVGLRVDYNNYGRLVDDPNGERSDLWSINAIVRF